MFVAEVQPSCRWVTRFGGAWMFVAEVQPSCRWVTRFGGAWMFVTEVQPSCRWVTGFAGPWMFVTEVQLTQEDLCPHAAAAADVWRGGTSNPAVCRESSGNRAAALVAHRRDRASQPRDWTQPRSACSNSQMGIPRSDPRLPHDSWILICGSRTTDTASCLAWARGQ